MIDIITLSRSTLPSVRGGSPLELPLYISLILKLTVHNTYTEKLQRNELIKLYTIYTSTVNRLMELTRRVRKIMLALFLIISGDDQSLLYTPK